MQKYNKYGLLLMSCLISNQSFATDSSALSTGIAIAFLAGSAVTYGLGIATNKTNNDAVILNNALNTHSQKKQQYECEFDIQDNDLLKSLSNCLNKSNKAIDQYQSTLRQNLLEVQECKNNVQTVLVKKDRGVELLAVENAYNTLQSLEIFLNTIDNLVKNNKELLILQNELNKVKKTFNREIGLFAQLQRKEISDTSYKQEIRNACSSRGARKETSYVYADSIPEFSRAYKSLHDSLEEAKDKNNSAEYHHIITQAQDVMKAIEAAHDYVHSQNLYAKDVRHKQQHLDQQAIAHSNNNIAQKMQEENDAKRALEAAMKRKNEIEAQKANNQARELTYKEEEARQGHIFGPERARLLTQINDLKNMLQNNKEIAEKDKYHIIQDWNIKLVEVNKKYDELEKWNNVLKDELKKAKASGTASFEQIQRIKRQENNIQEAVTKVNNLENKDIFNSSKPFPFNPSSPDFKADYNQKMASILTALNEIKKTLIETCVICDENFPVKAGPNETTTPCGHFYHTSCLKPWADTKGTCPVCCKPIV